MMRLAYRSVARFTLDHSHLTAPITMEATRNYTIPTKNPISGYLTQNADSRHVVIMIHQWWGFNRSIVRTADIFANKKLRVFVPDLYRGSPAINEEDAEHKMNHLDWAKALEDIDAIRDHFSSRENRVSIMGFCMGGALTFASLASIKGFRAGAVFYGVPDLNTFKVQNISTKVIAHFGSLDPLQGFSDPETAKKLQQQAKQNKVNLQVKIWDGVSHAFSNQDSKYFNPNVRDFAFTLTRKLFES